MEDPNAVLPPVQQQLSQQFPVIYKQHVVYLSSQSAREQFMKNPEKYLDQASPGPGVPVRLALLGPPKSGKSTGMACIAIVLVLSLLYTLFL